MKFWPRVRGVTFGLICGVGVLAASSGMAAVKIERVTSAKGIEAWLVHDGSVPVISMSFEFRGGSALDPIGKEGLSEMVSGLLDEGAGDLDSQSFQKLLEDESIYLSFDTDRDIFSGRLRILSKKQDRAFDLLRLALTKPRFDPEPVGRIREQIETRIRRNAASPQHIADRSLWEAVYPNHPYGRPSEGTPESLATLTVDDLHGFVHSRFTRDRLIVGIAGDIDAETLKPLLDKAFGDLPAQGGTIDLPEVEPKIIGISVIDRNIPQTVVRFVAPGIPRRDPDFFAALLVSYILGGDGLTSRLAETVREKNGLAYSIGAGLATLDKSALISGAFATENSRAGRALDLTRAEWARMGHEGPTAAELAAAKTYLLGSYPLRFTTTNDIAQQLMGIQHEKLDIDYANTRQEKINRVTLTDATRVARRLFDPSQLSIIAVGRPIGITESSVPPSPRKAPSEPRSK
ncbi:MAG: pitrilysin family protein [Alphaproteobacteria bacterium]